MAISVKASNVGEPCEFDLDWSLSGLKGPNTSSDEPRLFVSPGAPSSQPSPTESSWFDVPEQVLTELICLFFERVQTWLPLLHRPRFLQRFMPTGILDRNTALHSSGKEAFLLCGMLSLAARYSVNDYFGKIPARDRGHRFFVDASAYYDAISTSEEEVSLDYLQGCILLAYYLYACRPCQRAWILSGICVRVAYDLDLNSIDDDGVRYKDAALWSAAEERRRAFWLVWEIDAFSARLCRRPRAISTHDVVVRLPVSDRAWFADEPVDSPTLDPKPFKAWKCLLDSPNQDPRVWYIVANYLLILACELASSRRSPQESQTELVNSLTCLCLVVSERYGLDIHAASFEWHDTAKHNWIIAMHLMLTCTRHCVLTFGTSQTAALLAYLWELHRVINYWHPKSITSSHPFLAPIMLSVRAYPCTRTPPRHSDDSLQEDDMTGLVLRRIASVWGLGSVLIDLDVLTGYRGRFSPEQFSLAKRFALFFPQDALKAGRSDCSQEAADNQKHSKLTGDDRSKGQEDWDALSGLTLPCHFNEELEVPAEPSGLGSIVATKGLEDTYDWDWFFKA